MGDPESRPERPATEKSTTPSLPPTTRPVFAPPRPTPGAHGTLPPPARTPIPSARPPAPSARPPGTPPPPPLRTGPPPAPSTRVNGAPATAPPPAVRSVEPEITRVSSLPPAAHETPRIADLTTKLIQSGKDLMATQTELHSARKECEQLRGRGVADRARIGELERELTDARARIAELEARLTTPYESSLPPARPTVDDLTRLRGVGPAFARSLEGHGVVRFADVAAWTDADVEHVARLLKIRPERIRRDDWIGSARALLRDASPEGG